MVDLSNNKIYEGRWLAWWIADHPEIKKYYFERLYNHFGIPETIETGEFEQLDRFNIKFVAERPKKLITVADWIHRMYPVDFSAYLDISIFTRIGIEASNIYRIIYDRKPEKSTERRIHGNFVKAYNSEFDSLIVATAIYRTMTWAISKDKIDSDLLCLILPQLYFDVLGYREEETGDQRKPGDLWRQFTDSTRLSVLKEALKQDIKNTLEQYIIPSQDMKSKLINTIQRHEEYPVVEDTQEEPLDWVCGKIVGGEEPDYLDTKDWMLYVYAIDYFSEEPILIKIGIEIVNAFKRRNNGIGPKAIDGVIVYDCNNQDHREIITQTVERVTEWLLRNNIIRPGFARHVMYRSTEIYLDEEGDDDFLLRSIKEAEAKPDCDRADELVYIHSEQLKSERLMRHPNFRWVLDPTRVYS